MPNECCEFWWKLRLKISSFSPVHKNFLFSHRRKTVTKHAEHVWWKIAKTRRQKIKKENIKCIQTFEMWYNSCSEFLHIYFFFLLLFLLFSFYFHLSLSMNSIPNRKRPHIHIHENKKWFCMHKVDLILFMRNICIYTGCSGQAHSKNFQSIANRKIHSFQPNGFYITLCASFGLLLFIYVGAFEQVLFTIFMCTKCRMYIDQQTNKFEIKKKYIIWK